MDEYLDFAGQHWALFVALAIVLALIFFEEIRRLRNAASELAPALAVQMLNRGALVLDCRQAEAFGKGHIVGARNLPLNDLGNEQLEKLKHGKPVLAVGATPRDATRAAGMLRRAGFEKVYVIKGGLDAWRKEHLPLEQGAGNQAGAQAHQKKQRSGKK